MAVLLLAAAQATQGGWKSLAHLPMNLLGLDYFVDGSLMLWFPPAMIGTYLLFLVIWPWFRKTPHSYALATCLCVVAWSGGAILSSTGTAIYLLIWTTRLPTFFLGIAIGKNLAAGNPSIRIAPLWLLASGIGGGALWLGLRNALPDYASWRWGAIWAPFFFLALPLSIAAGKFAEWLPITLAKWMIPLRWMGENSLELYLFHLVVVETLWRDFDSRFHAGFGIADLLCLAIAFALTPLSKSLTGLPFLGVSRKKIIDPGKGSTSRGIDGKA
jgi:peptidoglycan/LPS O-acetylase OafA/YrhL